MTSLDRELLLLADSMERFGLSDDSQIIRKCVVKMTVMRNIFAAAKDLHDYLASNCGDNADWPLEMIARDGESSEKLVQKLNQLRDALTHNKIED